jgi:tripartite-type tricarboxylate transporter receptor subunit TctC
VKPLVEQGFPGLVFFNWEGVFAPAKTPDAVAGTIGAGLQRVMSDAEIRSKLLGMDLEPVWDGPETVSKAIAGDLMRWTQLARFAKMEAPQ